MATLGSMKDNDRSKVEELKNQFSDLMSEVEEKLFDCDQELPHEESRTSATIANIENVKNLLSELQKILRDKASSSSTGPKDKPHQRLSLEEDKLENLKVSYDDLNYQLRICLLYLSIIPEGAVMKKRPIIYWWIANGLIKPMTGEIEKTAEEIGEDIFEELLQLELIMPCDKEKSPIVNRGLIHPGIHHILISSARRANLFDFDDGVLGNGIAISGHACLLRDGDSKALELQQSPGDKITNLDRNNLKTIFNVSDMYLSLDLTKLVNSKKLVALQLGRWQGSPSYHIEVLHKDYFTFKALGTQKQLKYLSLRGISKITELPGSIVELTNLEILDLKACYNLATLPLDISALKKLTHLDVSQCHFLERMPSGLGELSLLQALKGFIIADSKKNPYNIGHLKPLKNLKRLSIYVGKEADIQNGDFERLGELESLQRLKISWGLASSMQKRQVMKEKFEFPGLLEKLTLEGLPYKRLPDWLNPSKLQNLKMLYITGGNLDDIKFDYIIDFDHGETNKHEWRVEILGVWYTKNMQIDKFKLKDWFPYLRCAPDIQYIEMFNQHQQTQKTK